MKVLKESMIVAFAFVGVVVGAGFATVKKYSNFSQVTVNSVY